MANKQKAGINFRTASAIAHDLYRECPVWETVALEEELKRRFEQTEGVEPLDEKAKTGAGRTRWRNIVDWVKADMTRYGETVTADIGGREWRVLVARAGIIAGVAYVPEDHFRAVLDALARRLLR